MRLQNHSIECALGSMVRAASGSSASVTSCYEIGVLDTNRLIQNEIFSKMQLRMIHDRYASVRAIFLNLWKTSKANVTTLGCTALHSKVMFFWNVFCKTV